MYIWILSYIKRIVQHFQMYASQFLTESVRLALTYKLKTSVFLCRFLKRFYLGNLLVKVKPESWQWNSDQSFLKKS